MTEATFRVTFDSKTIGKAKPWWAETVQIDGRKPDGFPLGHGETPGKAVDDLMSKLNCKTFVVPS